MGGIRVIVCGGRDFTDHLVICCFLADFHAARPIRHLHHGNARGVDTIAGWWGRGQHIAVHATPADWTKYGKRAGPVRNQHMLGHKPDAVIAFPGGRGTADMVKRARRAGVEVIEVPATWSRGAAKEKPPVDAGGLREAVSSDTPAQNHV